jgi:uncharacterized membrane protein YfcA
LIEEPLFYLLAVPAVLILGISKGGFGGGLGALAVPLVALAVSPIQAAAVLLPILCVMDLQGAWVYRGRWDKANLKILIPAALIGLAIGTYSFRYLDAQAIRLIIGTVAVGFTVHHWLSGLRGVHGARAAHALRGTFWGAVSGFTSFIAHAAGPPLSVYLLPQRMDKTRFLATTIIFVLFMNYVKLVPYAWLGQFSSENIYTSLALLPLAPLGMGLGIWMHRIVPEKVFYRICYLLLFLAGLKLLFDGGSEYFQV